MKKIGVRLGNWLLPDHAMALLDAPDPEAMKGKRDLALMAILVACGLRRHEAVELNVSDLQQRRPLGARRLDRQSFSHSDDPGAGLGVKDLIDDWLQSTGISIGRIFRRVTRAGTAWGQYATRAGVEKLAHTIYGELVPGSAIRLVAS